MPTLTAGTSTTAALTNGQYVHMKNNRGEAARLEFANGVPVKVAHNGAAVYGPFAAQTVKISSLVGTLTYTTGALGTVSPMGRL